jgi:hypothetical protein
MTSLLRLTAPLALVVIAGLAAQTASAQVSHTFTFDSGATDEGWATPFAGSDDKAFSIVNIGGSNRIQIPNTDGFQDAGRGEGIAVGGTGSTFFQSMAAAAADPAGYELSYDWYIDTTQVSAASFAQLASFVNTGSGYYAQNFPATGKEAELGGAQLSSGQVLTGSVTVPFTAYRDANSATLPTGETFYRIGLIINAGAGAQIPVYYDNISVRPVPEPTSLAVLGLAVAAVAVRRRRSA